MEHLLYIVICSRWVNRIFSLQPVLGRMDSGVKQLPIIWAICRSEIIRPHFFQQQIEIPFFAYYLEGKDNRTDIAGASIIFSGSNRKSRFDSWPPRHVVKHNLYLSSDRKSDWGKISFSRNQKTTKSEYVSNPSRPVPYSARIAQRRNAEYMTADQRFASRRPDVLTYISEPLTSPLTLAGQLGIHLSVSVDVTDADFVVKLIDLNPQQFVDIYTCKTSDSRTAKLTVYEGGDNGSYISLPVLK